MTEVGKVNGLNADYQMQQSGSVKPQDAKLLFDPKGGDDPFKNFKPAQRDDARGQMNAAQNEIKNALNMLKSKDSKFRDKAFMQELQDYLLNSFPDPGKDNYKTNDKANNYSLWLADVGQWKLWCYSEINSLSDSTVTEKINANTNTQAAAIIQNDNENTAAIMNEIQGLAEELAITKDELLAYMDSLSQEMAQLGQDVQNAQQRILSAIRQAKIEIEQEMQEEADRIVQNDNDNATAIVHASADFAHALADQADQNTQDIIHEEQDGAFPGSRSWARGVARRTGDYIHRVQDRARRFLGLQ